nr:uncharacterized protein LOC112711759 isoform X1 [Arachis hypogaea]
MGDLSVILVTFLLLQTLSATTDFLSPIYEDVCKEVECGKGACKPSKNSTFLYECECNPGWKQSLSSHTQVFTFLPCIVPNSWKPLPLLHTKKEDPMNQCLMVTDRKTTAIKCCCSNSFRVYILFDHVACFWVDCGGGSCNKTSPFSYNCHCDAGYYNILNATAFPCVKQCAIGIGCSNLGIPMTNSSTTAPPPTLSASASSTLQGSCIGLLMLIMLMASIQLH